jgi:hypothetical protein
MQGRPPNPRRRVPLAGPLPKLPTTLTVRVGVHAHIPGPRRHDDHTCDHVTCALCDKPGLAIHGVWLDIVD